MSRVPIVGKLIKKVKKAPLFGFIIKNILYFYVKMLFFTYWLEVQNDFQTVSSDDLKQGVFYFWHQNILAATFFFSTKKMVGHCIISPSDDGKLMGFIAQKLGFKVLYGSKYKDSVKLIRHSLDVLQANKRIAVVGDGSRGPAFKLQRGIIYLASKSQVPLVFIECKAQWAFTIKKSWDNFKLPLPFSKIFVKIHTPVKLSSTSYKDF